MDPRLNKQPASAKPKAGPTPAELLAKIPRRPMTPEQQAVALEKVQQQATQRVKLGQQLFEAADARLKQHQQVLDDINQQQAKLREKVQEDVAKSLNSYDQWMGKIDESFTQAIRELNQRIEGLEAKLEISQSEMASMVDKAAALLKQTQGLLTEAIDEGVVTREMQQSVPDDPHIDIDSLGVPSLQIENAGIDSDAIAYETGPEVIEVDIVGPSETNAADTSMPYDAPSTDEGDDVFGEVLRRLRSQGNDGQDAAA